MRSKFKGNEGSFTIEASLVMPIILMVTIILMFFCMYIYQQSFLQQVASAATERSAYVWDNSHKEASSGAVQPGQHDSLYWRLSDDNMLGSIFGWAGAGSEESISLPVGGESSSLPVEKLTKVSELATGEMTGNLTYENKLLFRKVNAELHQLINLPLLDRILSGGSEIEVHAQSLIVEPVEFIRTVDLMRYYGAKFKGSGSSDSSSMNKGDAAKVLQKYGSKTK
ncbi:TadE family protein [Paenibacillus crassostreae]|uniref:Pilus assembly protein TadE n=1 Tax=Paenibacillus crassostreae TaxID=1763538 RepID=A0A167GKL1_9BACL|nr:TadE family protein [Paenibacillus crassostreae]AOZ92197.1 pilus assembly protein TadE [Paenibacillus crassostreae]OAB77659.1 pilus assembly protein TadE [Paenibacillus crassostreae]